MPTTARRLTALVATVATAALVPLVHASPAQARAERGRVTDYGFAGSAYGSRAGAEPLGVGSSRSAYAYLSCTRRTGERRSNSVAATGDDVGSVLRVSGVDNRTRSYRNRRQFGERSVSTVADVVMGDPEGAHLTIEQLRTTTKASVDRSSGRLGAVVASTSGRVRAHTGTPLDLLINQPGTGLEELLAMVRESGGSLPVPGVGEIKLGHQRTRTRGDIAVAKGMALRATLYGQDSAPGGDDDVRVVLARARSTVFEDVTSGVMRGRAVPLESTLAGGLAQVGRVIDEPLPCPGTDGEVNRSSLAHVNPDGQLGMHGLTGRAFGVQKRNGSARAWTEASLTDVTLGGGQVELHGVVGRANVRTNENGRIVRKNTHGSSVGRLVINGETQPDPVPGDVVEVPGVARLEFFVTDRRPRGLRVTAVRISLLDDTAVTSVLDLGEARTYVTRS